MPAETFVTPQRSAWLRTAPAAPLTGALQGKLSTQVLVIGGGIAALNCAIRCAELGQDVVLIEAQAIGFGASGRSGGQLIPGLKHDPATLVKMLGEDAGARLARFAGDAPDETFRLIARYGIECDAQQKGWLQPATDAANMKTVVARAKAWASFTGQPFPTLGPDEIKALTGTDAYVGGWMDPRGGQVQPLSYTRCLAHLAVSLGVKLYSESRATETARHDGRWKVSANGHEIRADKLMIFTNGYGMGMGEPYSRAFIPASSIIVSTQPLPPAIRREVLPSGLPTSDARRLLNYYRFDPEGRFMIGSRGSFGLHEPQGGFDTLRRTAVQLFPALQGATWEDAWGGFFALTTDFLPHVHMPAENAWTLLGCNGRGMAMMSVGARAVAELALSGDTQACPLPVTPMPRIPLHGFRRPALEAATLWYRVRDRFGF